MLVLTRNVRQKIRIGEDIVVTVVKIQGAQVAIGIEAPLVVPVHRQEIYERIRHEAKQIEAIEQRELARQRRKAKKKTAAKLATPKTGQGDPTP